MESIKGNGGCSDFSECMEILNLILDNEATKEQTDYFRVHIEGCMVCFQHYEVEQYIRELIKNKLVQQPVPVDLANRIREKINFFHAE